MGNCFQKRKKSTVEIAPCDFAAIKSSSVPVHLYGSSTGNLTAYARLALRYKSLSVHFISTDTFNDGGGDDGGRVTLQIGAETVSAVTPDTLLRFIDAKFPQPPPLVASVTENYAFGETTSLIVKAVALQHKSLWRQMERVVTWTEDFVTRGERRDVDLSVGSPKMEFRKLCKRYSLLHEVLVEHAQMEERVIFPLLEIADRGACKVVNMEHARDLPIMNGIKEDMKSIGVMGSESPDYQEALFNLVDRLKLLQVHCKQHFEEEERDLMPLMMGIELSRVQEIRALKQCFEVMQGTHDSPLFKFFIEGLLPSEAMQYLDLILTCKDEKQFACLLHMIID